MPRPRTYWDGFYWVSEFDHDSWVDRTDYATWERAYEHSLWLGLCEGVWSA